jgi:hypothetical protein
VWLAARPRRPFLGTPLSCAKPRALKERLEIFPRGRHTAVLSAVASLFRYRSRTSPDTGMRESFGVVRSSSSTTSNPGSIFVGRAASRTSMWRTSISKPRHHDCPSSQFQRALLSRDPLSQIRPRSGPSSRIIFQHLSLRRPPVRRLAPRGAKLAWQDTTSFVTPGFRDRPGGLAKIPI